MRLFSSMRLGMAALVLSLAAGLAACIVTITAADGSWTAECTGVVPDDCRGIAELLVGNLAWSGEAIRQESGGIVRISPALTCPAMPDWADPSSCWRAEAPIRTARACMLIGARKDPAYVARFGQVGGDNYTGVFGAPKPGTTPC